VSALEHLVTAIPGPRSRELAQRLRASESRGVTYLSNDFPTFWDSASGATVTDVDGNRFLDLTSAFGVATTGHANPAVSRAIAEQAARLAHGMGDVHPSAVKQALLDRLTAIVPMQPAKAFLCSTGSEAVEFALKTALLATGRPNALAFAGAYHGLAHGALEVTGIEKFRVPFLAQLRAATRFVAYPDRRDPAALARALEAVEATLRADASLGAVIVEPIQGRAGVVVPPDGFLRGLRAACDAHGALLIVDEIYTGFGRTGTLFAIEHDGVSPDLLCAGKALGGGFPLAVTAGTAAVMDAWAPSQGEALHTSTYLGNPMGCAAALANIGEIERLDIVARARDLGPRIDVLLAPLHGNGAVRDVRGRGALWGIECQDGGAAHAWTMRALRNGVIVLQSGPRGETLTVAPPVVIDDAQLERALAILVATAPR
jgi:4-aminobutyrate aminotransferase-like enzyme